MKTWTRLLFGATALTALSLAAPALAADLDQPVTFNIAAGSLDDALIAYSQQADLQVISASNAVRGKRTQGVEGATTPREALAMLLQDSGLSFVATSPSTVTVTQGEQGADGSSADATVEALIVTAQKREENIQDVPIAISAFSQKSLDEQKIEGGFDLVKAIPNVSFSKNNFTSYNFSIRGVGTKALSATTDPGVAVAFNNTTIIQNRLFEQEYYDLERVEVLRGPQGTLYGRNATSGVINVISAKPDLNDFDGWLKGEVGNYDTKRLSAMVNVPVIEDKLAVRLAGALTQRQGYDYNSVTGNAVNGRDLWSARVTIGFEPTENLRGNLVWERFEEDDNRSRTGKQLCKRDDGLAFINGVNVEATGAPTFFKPGIRTSWFSQGCSPVSLYSDEAFDTPNGLAIAFISGAVAAGGLFSIGFNAEGGHGVIQQVDPYGGLRQSTNLREIASIRDPVYRASADLVELNVDFDLTENLTFSSQTAYVDDSTYSFQDFNRFNSVPIFTDTSTIGRVGEGDWRGLSPGGVFCDPQIGCSNTIAGFDIAQAEATQFSQEFRLQSSFDGPLNFNIGANYTKFDVLVDYYIMFNLLTALATTLPQNYPGAAVPFSPYVPGVCNSNQYFGDFPSPAPVPTTDINSFCVHIDPNPLDTSENFEGDGHNYFRSKNPYNLDSWAAFGEVYWNVRDDLKLTVGLRYTEDKKTTIPVPTQLLLSRNAFTGGVVSSGYPEEPAIEQEWGEWTGRLGIDWKPDLAFTDSTLLYAFYSRGYKGGGTNPPRPDFATKEEILQIQADQGLDQGIIDALAELWPVLRLTAVEYGETFDPEFVDAFEIGSKSSLLDGGMTFNATAFYYDYKDYQVSQVRDRSAVNENFDATTWGLEFEMLFAPSRDLQIIANFGYLDTKIADGETSIDIMNRTQGDPNFVIAKPWFQLPSNCVIPKEYAVAVLQAASNWQGYPSLCGGMGGAIGFFVAVPVNDPNFPGAPLNYDNYPQLNGGAGIAADVGGNELPNAPHWTANVGTQYGWDFLEGWRATVRGDVYWQSQSWHRVYNLDPYDKLHGWFNANLSLWIERPEDGLKIELYAKNILNDTPITDAFLNSDDTGLTTNVFTLDPRLIGLSIRKEF